MRFLTAAGELGQAPPRIPSTARSAFYCFEAAAKEGDMSASPSYEP